MKAYSNDLLEELDRELTQVFPGANELIYHFLDSKAVISLADLEDIYVGARISPSDFAQVTDFLQYYGVLGIRAGDSDHFIYSVNYDLKVLKIRAARSGPHAQYIINPAFWPGLDIAPPATQSMLPGGPTI